MKFAFKKVASVLASVAMLGSTIGIAAAASYPAPFVSGGVADVAIVVGANAATVDNIAATDITSDLSSELAKQTAGSGTTTIGVTGGDSVELGTSTSRVYYNTSINTARTTVTKTEMPNLLADGTVVTTVANYPYKQTVVVGALNVSYGTSGADIDDPTLLIDVGTLTTATGISDTNNTWYLYRYTLTFDKAINVSHTDVQGNNIVIQGTDYTIGPQSLGTILYLYGAGVSKELNEGESTTVTVAGTEYEIALVSIGTASGSNVAYVSIDGGESKRVAEGNTSTIGDVEVYAKRVDYLAKTGTVSSAILNIGTKRLKFQDGQRVKTGTEEEAVQGTHVNITNSSPGQISALHLYVAKQKILSDYVLMGESFTDPVFGGLAYQFASLSNPIDSNARDSIVVDTDNNANARVTFTSTLAGTAGESTITFAHDTATNTSAVIPVLSDSANKTIHVVEGENVAINEYMVIDSGDSGRIIQLIDYSCTGSTTDYVTFQDAITTDQFKLTTGADCKGSLNIDGQTYYIVNSSTAGVSYNVTYGSGASEGSAGNAITVFPRIKLAKGEWIAFLTQANLTGNVSYIFPGTETLSTTGIKINDSHTGNLTDFVGFPVGNINWSTRVLDYADARIVGIDTDDIEGNGTFEINFSYAPSAGPAILLLEEHKTGESNGDVIVVPLTTTGGSAPEIAIGTPATTDPDAGAFRSTPTLSTWTSDSYKSSAITQYGTYVERDTTSGTNYKVTIKYPDEHVYANILLTTAGATVGGGTTSANVAELGSVAVMDSEVSSVKSKNLIVVGGSCINTVAATLLGSSTPLCGASFTDETGISSGQFLIEVFDNPYTQGQVAMLVAGYEGADTRKAATYLTTKTVASDVGTSIKKVTATYADVV